MKVALIVTACLALSDLARGQALSVSIAPAEPLPGSIVRFSLKGSPEPADSILSIRGQLAGEPLQFLAADSGRYHAIGAIPVDASNRVVATIFVRRASKSVDTLQVAVPVPPVEIPTTEPKLAVAERYTRPLDARTQARIARENARARAVGQRAHQSPPMWTADFQRPRESRLTSDFGTGRMFNGKVASRHLGVDFAGDPGAPVRAANRGVVALVDTFFLAGRLVYIDHGGGVVTGYFHLSKPVVAKGDTVSRGQVIGLVGATGRVTGPHLHWAVRYGAHTVNPLDLLALEERWYSGALASASP